MQKKNPPEQHALVCIQDLQDEPGTARILFEGSCAVLFLCLAGLALYKAILRDCFAVASPACEAWIHFFLSYLTCLGVIEAFLCQGHPACGLLVRRLSGWHCKSARLLASLCSLLALGLLFWGGVVFVLELQESATAARLTVNAARSLPIMALVALLTELRAFWDLLFFPADEMEAEEQE